MAFQIKDFASIVASMINWMKSTQTKVTDFNPGSVARTLVEAPGSEIEELYRRMFDGLKEAIPVATYNSFNFSALPAQPTRGLVRVVIAAQATDTLIAAGTVASYTNGQVSYASTQDVMIRAGDTFADVLVSASQAGTLGNVAADTQFTLAPAPTGFASATNLAPWINGTDAETEDERKVRFTDYIKTLVRGTPEAIEYGLKTTYLTDAAGNEIERVVSAKVVEPYELDNTQPTGLVNFYIHNGVGSTSGDLLSRAKQVVYGYYDGNGNAVPGWKAAGAHVEGYIATEVLMNVRGALTALAGYDKPTLVALAQQTTIAYITALEIGQGFQVAELVKQIKLITGVDNFVPGDAFPPAAPSLDSAPGGALAAATYYVAITYVTPQGETLASPVASLAVAANNLLTVDSPPAYAGAVGWNVYVGTSAGSLQKQNAGQLGIGSGFIEAETGLVAGSAPPTVSTARLVDFTPAPSQKLMPGTVTID